MSFVNIFDNQGEANQEQILKEILLKLQKCQNREEYEDLIQKIVDLALQSRSLCRKYQGKPLNKISQLIYDEVHEGIKSIVIQKCEQLFLTLNSESCLAKNNSNYLNLITCEWLQQIQIKVFREVLTDHKLKQLALFAQKQTSPSSLRSFVLTELVQAITISNRLCRPHKGLFKADFYNLIYEEAVINTMSYLCLNIDKYDPQKGQGKFMTWVNFKLDKEVLLCRQKFDLSYKYPRNELPDFDVIAYQPKPKNQADLLYQYLELDPQRIFRQTHIVGKPQANFQFIALQRLSGKTWKEIAQTLQENIPRLSAFYQRSCKKFQYLLRQELEK